MSLRLRPGEGDAAAWPFVVRITARAGDHRRGDHPLRVTARGLAAGICPVAHALSAPAHIRKPGDHRRHRLRLDRLGESLERGRRLTLGELRAIARREYSILAAAIPPVVVLELGAAGVLRQPTAFALALGLGAAALTYQGVRYARLERLSRLGTALTIAVNLILALLIVAIEVGVSH